MPRNCEPRRCLVFLNLLRIELEGPLYKGGDRIVIAGSRLTYWDAQAWSGGANVGSRALIGSYGGVLGIREARRLRRENTNLKKIVAERDLNSEVIFGYKRRSIRQHKPILSSYPPAYLKG